MGGTILLEDVLLANGLFLASGQADALSGCPTSALETWREMSQVYNPTLSSWPMRQQTDFAIMALSVVHLRCAWLLLSRKLRRRRRAGWRGRGRAGPALP